MYNGGTTPSTCCVFLQKSPRERAFTEERESTRRLVRLRLRRVLRRRSTTPRARCTIRSRSSSASRIRCARGQFLLRARQISRQIHLGAPLKYRPQIPSRPTLTAGREVSGGGARRPHDAAATEEVGGGGAGAAQGGGAAGAEGRGGGAEGRGHGGSCCGGTGTEAGGHGWSCGGAGADEFRPPRPCAGAERSKRRFGSYSSDFIVRRKLLLQWWQQPFVSTMDAIFRSCNMINQRDCQRGCREAKGGKKV